MSDSDLAFRDPLTGALNRRFLTQLFTERWRELREAHGPVAVVLIDLDLFKEVNDRHGHLMGDGFLKATAARLVELVRRSDFVIRYGGDEFVVVLPGMGEPEAERLMGAVRSSAAERRLTIETGDARLEQAVAFSYGVGSSPGDGESGEQALAAADRRLYEDKRRRRRATDLRRGAPRALVLAVVLLVLVGIGTGISKMRRLARLDAEAIPAPSVSPLALIALAATPSPQEVVVPGALEAALLTQIDDLKRQIDVLRKEVAKQPSAPKREPAELDALRDTVEQLEEQLHDAHPAETGSAPTPRPGEARPTPAPALASGKGTPAPVAGAAHVAPHASPAGVATIAAIASPGSGASPGAGPLPSPGVTPGGSIESAPLAVVPPVLARFVKPRYPRAARELRKEATVVVRVTVDPEGHVINAVSEGGPYGYGFEEAALAAARGARYRPGKIDGTPAEMDAKLLFKFRVEGSG